MPTRRELLGAMAAVPAASLLGLRDAHAQDAWPSRPITIVVPGQPGSGNDLTGRVLAQELSVILGVPVVIDNKSGGRGAIAMQAVARAKPDGYTYVVVIASMAVIMPSVTKVMPWDIREFVPVAQYAGLPTVFMTSRDSGINSVAEPIALARAQPGKINYGNGSTMTQMAMEMFNQQTGAGLTGIPYRGPAEAGKDLAGGLIQLDLQGVAAAVTSLQGGRTKALAMLATQRHPALPQVQTMAELGFKDFEFDGWAGVMAHRQTPDAIVQKMNAAIRKAVASEDFKRRFEGMMVTPISTTTAEFAAIMARESAKYERIARAAKLEKT